jgi:tRNA1Val (adenine37-N6)-methyltransferase
MTQYPDETIDRLTSKLNIVQKRRGHRAASDDMLLAWAAAQAQPEARRVLDLGSGKGTVAMLLLQRLPHCRAVGLEALQISHELAIRNAHLNSLKDRWDPRLGDLRDPSALAGEARFDLITGAPPFMPVGSGVMPKDPQRAAGRFELRGSIRDYAETSAKNLARGGKAVFLMDGLESSKLRTIQALAAAGLFVNQIIAVHPSPGRSPIYWIFETGPDSGSTAEQSLFIRNGDTNAFSPDFEAIRREMDCA